MKKTVIIFGAILFILVVVAIIFFRSSSDANPSVLSPGAANDGLYSPVSDASRQNFSAGNEIVLGTSAGAVTVKNFYKGATQSIDELDDLVVKDTPKFSIIYNIPTSNFDLFIKQKPVQESRLAAEKELLSILGIDQASACKLSAQATIPYSLDQELGGRHYPLSFCSAIPR